MNQMPFLPARPPRQPLSETDPPQSFVLQYWDVVRRRLGLIAATICASLVLGLVLTLLVTPRYTATARIAIEREAANVTNVEGLQPEQNQQNLEFYQTQYSLLNARSLAERVVAALKLTQDKSFVEAHDLQLGLFSLERPRQASASEARRLEGEAAKALLDNVMISPVRGSALVDVSYRSTSPTLAARISNAWVEQFVSQSTDRRFASTADARRFLEERLEALRVRLEQSERDLVGYAEQRKIVRLAEVRSADGKTDTSRTLLGAEIEALNAELISATARRVDAESQLDAVRGGGVNSDAIANSAINRLRESRAEKTAQYAELMERFDPDYPQARALKGQIAALDQSVGREEQRVRGVTTTAYQAARQREDILRAKVDKLLGDLSGQNRATIQYNIYQREVDTNRQLYDGLLQRYKEIGVAGVGTNNIAIVDPAIVPTVRSSPKLWLNMLLALVAGIALAAAAVFVLENLDERIRMPDEVSQSLGLPLLGAIPIAENGDLVGLIKDPKTRISEAYMALQTNLAFATDHGFPRTISVTSSIPSEGKSTSSFALARSLSRTGKKVLLVDIDLRRPSLAKLLKLDSSKGVSNYLAGEYDWASLIQPAAVERLNVMTSGPIPPSAAELLSGPRLEQLVKQLSGQFDHVIFDSPPLLGIADAPLVAAAVEGTILVIEAERVNTKVARNAISRLKAANIRIFGAVLTRYRSARSGSGSGYDYDYYYYADGGDARNVKAA
jgi:capsular exopolysaccharide synthesis family protein